MKNYNSLPKVAGQMISAFSIIASAMLIFASCSKDNEPGQQLAKELPPALKEGDIAIAIKHGACADGTCPVYDFQVSQSGILFYNGYENVAKKGNVQLIVDASIVKNLYVMAQNNGFFNLKNEYPGNPDAAIVSTTISWDRKGKTVIDHSIDVPDILKLTKQTIEAKLGITELVGNDGAGTGGQAELVIALRHEGCNHDCPVYNLLLYKDGNVIFEGISNVGTIGTKEWNIGTDLVNALLDEAAANGFFDLKDEYPFSEEAKTITSILDKTVVDYEIEAPENLKQIKQIIEDKLEISGFIN